MISRLFDIPKRQLELFPKKDALASKVNGTWVLTSTEEFLKKADQISEGLLAMGLKKVIPTKVRESV